MIKEAFLSLLEPLQWTIILAWAVLYSLNCGDNLNPFKAGTFDIKGLLMGFDRP